MKRLLWWLGLVDLVWTQDYDGDLRLRVVWYNEDCEGFVYGICGPFLFGERPRRRMPNGTFEGGDATYMKKWSPYPQKPAPLAPKQKLSAFRRREHL